jgi:small subunit ribosomal protein S1
VFDKAEEMAARYKQMLLEQAEDGEPLGGDLD